MTEGQTTIIVRRYLGELAQLEGSTPAAPIIRALVDSSVSRLQQLCQSLLVRSYPRLTQSPLNLEADEMLSSVVNRLLKAMEEARPTTVRQFFALANQHMRWELNDLARRLDSQEPALELRDSYVAVQDTSGSRLSPRALRMLEAIDGLPEEEREVFSLVRVQGLTQSEVAAVLEVSQKTVQRRLNRALLLLTEQLSDLTPGPTEPATNPPPQPQGEE
jgi:RNA polymerase sigma factor (sigma-70 family)